jgi:hypothetical protein
MSSHFYRGVHRTPRSDPELASSPFEPATVSRHTSSSGQLQEYLHERELYQGALDQVLALQRIRNVVCLEGRPPGTCCRALSCPKWQRLCSSSLEVGVGPGLPKFKVIQPGSQLPGSHAPRSGGPQLRRQCCQVVPRVKSYRRPYKARLVNVETCSGACVSLLLQAYLAPRDVRLVAAEVARAAGGGAVACVCIPGVFQELREAFPGIESVLLDFNPWYQVRRARVLTSLYQPGLQPVVPGAPPCQESVLVCNPGVIVQQCCWTSTPGAWCVAPVGVPRGGACRRC